MVSAIGSASPVYSQAQSPASPTVLEAQLSRCQVQLADWVSCPSAKTPEGKAKIAEISDKIAQIEQRMKQVDNTPPGERANALPAASVNATDTRNRNEHGLQSAPASSNGISGGTLDIYA